MAYTQTVIDNFDDNSIDAAKWNRPTTGATETSAKYHMPCLSTYPQTEGLNSYNLANGILAVKYAKTGTATAESEFYMGAHDGAGNVISLLGGVANAYLAVEVSGSVTHSSDVITDTTIGIGPSWTANTWFGLGNLGSDNILRWYKSSDGQTWTEMARTTVGGTFGKTTARLYFMSGVWSGSSTYVADLDDASYWLNGGSSSPVKNKMRVGGAWVTGHPKVRVGGAWVAAKTKVRVAGAWVTLT